MKNQKSFLIALISCLISFFISFATKDSYFAVYLQPFTLRLVLISLQSILLIVTIIYATKSREQNRGQGHNLIMLGNVALITLVIFAFVAGNLFFIF